MRCLLAAAVLFAALPAAAQTPTPDTLDWRGYVPLAVGNHWQYEVSLRDPQVDYPEGLVHAFVRDQRIVGDTAVAGQAYLVVEERCGTTFAAPDFPDASLCDPFAVTTTLIRYDEALATVVARDRDDAGESSWPGLLSTGGYRLDTAFGSSSTSSGAPTYQFEGGYDQPFVIHGERKRAATKRISWDDLPAGAVLTFAHGIGLLDERTDGLTEKHYATLRFARIAGRRHGYPDAFPVDDPASLTSWARADTLDWRGYVPLTIGNEWQYTVEEGDTDLVAHRYLEDVRITGDTVLAGRAHFVVEKRCDTTFFRDDVLPTLAPCDPLDVERSFVRYDDAVANVVQHGHAPERPLWDVIVNRALSQRLDAPFGRASGFPLAYADSVAPIGGADIQTTVKWFLPITPAIMGMAEAYGHGIGYLGGSYAIVMDSLYEIDKRLVFAQVGGEQFGTRKTVATEPAESAPEPSAALYPNPASQTLRVRLGGAHGAATVRLYDMLGRAVLRQRCESACEIEVGALASGVYLARVQFARGGVATQRVTVAR